MLFRSDFEPIDAGGYYTNKVETGSACTWSLTNVGFWGSSSDRYNGSIAARFGNNDDSSMEMDEDKSKGAGVLTFKAGIFGSDASAEVKVLYSSDGGTVWTTVGTASITQASLQEFKFNVNVAGPIRFKFEQLSGKRLNIDDIAITDYTSSVGGITVGKTWDAFAVNGGVIVQSDCDDLVEIYSIDAVNVYRSIPSSDRVLIPLEKGAYIVVYGNDSRKVIVK